MMAEHNGLDITEQITDVYAGASETNPILAIRTHYEQQWLDRGLSIKYIKFSLGDMPLSEPPAADDLEHDTYRSYSRGYIQMPQQMDNNN